MGGRAERPVGGVLKWISFVMAYSSKITTLCSEGISPALALRETEAAPPTPPPPKPPLPTATTASASFGALKAQEYV